MDCKQYQKYTLNEANDENSKKTKEWIDVSLYFFTLFYVHYVQYFILNNYQKCSFNYHSRNLRNCNDHMYDGFSQVHDLEIFF